MSATTIDVALLAALPSLIDRIAQLEAEVRELRAKLAAQPATDDLISIDDAAAATGKSRAALYKLIRRGRLAATKKGRALFVKRADIDALVRR